MQAIDSCVHNFSVVGSNQVYASLVLSSAIGVDESGNKVAPAPVSNPGCFDLSLLCFRNADLRLRLRWKQQALHGPEVKLKSLLVPKTWVATKLQHRTWLSNFYVNTAILVHFMVSLLVASGCYKVYTAEQQERLGHTFVGEQCWHGSTHGVDMHFFSQVWMRMETRGPRRHPIIVPSEDCFVKPEGGKTGKTICQSTKSIYPPVNKHSNGTSPFSIGNTSSNGGFSIAMLDYRRVYVSMGCLNFTLKFFTYNIHS